MELRDDLEFGHEDRRRIYEYVERHGSATPEEIRRATGVDRRGMRHHAAILRRDGYLRAEGGELCVAFQEGESEHHRDGGLEFVIRPARQSDLTGLVGAIRRVAEDGTYIEAESVADIVDHEEVLLRHNAVESRMFFVATVGEEVVGWAHLHVPELRKLAHTAELTLGVLAEYRGHGIGSHLLARAVEWAAERGLEKLYQSVPSTNEEAVAFLESQGWEVEAVRADHYKLDGEYRDEVMLATRL
ncbi:MAG: GNAT family N-acetyltransferase [Halobacteriaceae archaeon]